MIKDIIFEVQYFNDARGWISLKINPNHETIESARERRFKFNLNVPLTKSRIVRVVREVWEE